jgi:hypothetical protein
LRDDERAAEVVRFWRAIEMFSPHDVPGRTRGKSNGDGWVLDLGPDDPGPWQPGFRPRWDRLPPDKTRIFTVFGGLYNVAHVQGVLKDVFGTDGKPEDARPADDRTAMFAFKVDAEGRFLENSATLSACAWAMHRLRTPGPDHPRWLDGFEFDERTFSTALDKLAPPKFAASDTAGTTASFGAKVGSAVAERVRSAARDAVDAGAKATGTAVTAAVAGVGAALAGPVVGGIAGAAAGTFVEKLLSPGSTDPADSPPDQQDPPRAPRYDLTPAALHEFVADLVEALGIQSLGIAGVHVECMVLSTKSAEKPNQQAFLNSFIADDLSRIEDDVRSGKAGGALAAYLSSGRNIPVADRIDVRRHRSALVDGVAPQRIPGGRWPAPADRSLVVSQQFAVNQLLGELGTRTGVFSVNGPPGTGKTTMLRDVLAGLVVERARRLADLDDPRDAFTDVLEAVSLGSNYTARVRGLRPEVTGFEVVLATNSNDAAANVTAEIPGIEAVEGSADEALAAGYFAELASHILEGNAWGLVAAVLGNRENRGVFADRFWWSDEIGMLAVLRRVRDNQAEVDDWGTAIARFRQAEQAVGELTHARQHVAAAIQQLRRWKAEMPRLEAALADARAECEQRNARVVQLGGWCHQSHGAYVAWYQEYENHLARKPGFWRSLSTWFRARRDWARRHAELAEFRDRARCEFDRLQAEVTLAQVDLAEAERRWHQRNQELERAKRSAEAARRRVDAARDRWPGKVPPGDRADEQAFQLCAPWADEEFCTARTGLFLEALRLHKAFLFNAETHARGNLAAITGLLQRRADVKPETLLAAWQTLFLVVPMVSTTFASLPRLFAGVGREALGWLFIDEAGQATAQQAAGGLWRCRRAVIVGDPQQLEPIVTLPLPAQHALRRYHGVDEEWTPDGASAQRVADRLARHGTYLREPNGEDDVWVGAPLRVHRRCDRLMFDISNRIAYGGDLMIYGTADRADYPGANAWLDVQSALSNGHWVPEEGRALRSLLAELAAEGVPARDIRVISPFRKVVRGSKERATAEFGRDFARDNVGTVHTVQGQEADVVVLVLGTGRGNDGARRWAAEKPNLLNVAVSRAKRRLYVIGDRSNWQGLRYFHELAEVLPDRIDTT